jgi:hypothetical protein
MKAELQAGMSPECNLLILLGLGAWREFLRR